MNRNNNTMSNDLFPTMPEALSPRLAWMKKHRINTDLPADGIHKSLWDAWSGCICAHGETEDEALSALAAKLGVRLWNETL